MPLNKTLMSKILFLQEFFNLLNSFYIILYID